MISFDDFSKLELKVGTMMEAEEIPGSEKLIKLMIDLGEENPRQILVGMKKWYQSDYFLGKQVVVVANLKPKVMMRLRSQGMILAADSPANGPILLKPSSKVLPGTKIR